MINYGLNKENVSMCVCYGYCNPGGSPLVSQAVGAWYQGPFSSLRNVFEV